MQALNDQNTASHDREGVPPRGKPKPLSALVINFSPEARRPQSSLIAARIPAGSAEEKNVKVYGLSVEDRGGPRGG